MGEKAKPHIFSDKVCSDPRQILEAGDTIAYLKFTVGPTINNLDRFPKARTLYDAIVEELS